jgi:hypothetical protein
MVMLRPKPSNREKTLNRESIRLRSIAVRSIVIARLRRTGCEWTRIREGAIRAYFVAVPGLRHKPRIDANGRELGKGVIRTNSWPSAIGRCIVHLCWLAENLREESGIFPTILGHLKYHLKQRDLLSADVRQNQRSKLRFGYDGALNLLSEAPG